MFKRLFWLMVGIGFGFGLAFWVSRAVKQTAARYTPERMSSDLAESVRGFGRDIRSAVAEGRAVMRDREDELRAEAERVLQRLPEPEPEPVAPPVPASTWAQPTGKLARQLVERLSRN